MTFKNKQNTLLTQGIEELHGMSKPSRQKPLAPPAPAAPPCREYNAFGILMNENDIENWRLNNVKN